MRRGQWFPTLVLMAALGVTGYWGYSQYTARRQLEVLLTNQYQDSFHKLISHVDDVSVQLSKGLVSTSPRMTVTTFSDVWRQAGDAQAELNQLPLRQGTLMRTSKFLTQVSDFSYTLAKKASDGRPVTDDDWRTLQGLKEEAEYLTRELRQMRESAQDGKFSWVEVARSGDRDLREASKNIVQDGFDRIDRQLTEMPTLIYDGPFSDHIDQQEPRGLTGADISADEAKRIAMRFIPLRDPSRYVAERDSEIKGKIEGYRIRIRNKDNKEATEALVDVSKKGGHVITAFITGEAKEKKISLEEAATRAMQFLESRGMKNMTPTYSGMNDNIAVIPFAYTENGVIIYPDLIKVRVSLEDGSILGYDALGYYINHHKRNIPKPRLTSAEARERVNDRLQLQGEPRLTIIPLETLQEVLCWEFRGTIDDNLFIVYISAMEGDEERILQVLDTPEGTLTL